MADKSITKENYEENPELDYSHCAQYRRNCDMFFKTKKIVLQQSTRQIYEYIKNTCIDYVKNHPQYPKFVWKPKIIDVGCGGGFGSNILSQEADFVWGIDVDEESIAWANQVFKRDKNFIYYTPQVQFDVINALTEEREIQKFDIVTCVEVIEHVNEYEKLLNFFKKRCKTDKNGRPLEPEEDGTMVYISTPNRNHPSIRDDKPKSNRHVREWTPEELYSILTKHFKYVTLMNPKGEPQELNMMDSVMLFKCETPIYEQKD